LRLGTASGELGPYVPGFVQWVVAVGVGLGVLVGVCVTVGELLAVADGLGVTWPAGVDDGWLRAAAATSTGSVDGAAAAITIPATIATMPPMPPAASNTGIREE